MSWPLTMPMGEAEKYRGQLDAAIAANGGRYNGRFAMMRHTAVYANEADRQAALNAIQSVLGMFGNLMTKSGTVTNGFPDRAPPESFEGKFKVDAKGLETNLMFGSPETVIGKLAQYEALGVDAFIYYASMGLGFAEQKRSLKLFIDKVMPAFAVAPARLSFNAGR